jgi:hypothetical protein
MSQIYDHIHAKHESALKNGDPVLPILHNAGFFSCSSIALEDLLVYYNTHKRLPETFDRSYQYLNYKGHPSQNLIPYYFREEESEIPFIKKIDVTLIKEAEPQFSDYKFLCHDDLKPFLDKYFTPSEKVMLMANTLKAKYDLLFSNTCAVFYRGNDKNRETKIGSYEEFISRAKLVQQANPGIQFLVQPDETEFLDAFLAEFPDSVYFSETPHMRKKDSVIFNELPQHKRAEYGAWFFAALLNISQCKHVILHSGNCGIWTCLYRGNSINVHQWLNDKWL